MITQERGACARRPNNKHSLCLFTQRYCKDRGGTSFPEMFLVPGAAEEPVIKALEVRANSALQT